MDFRKNSKRKLSSQLCGLCSSCHRPDCRELRRNSFGIHPVSLYPTAGKAEAQFLLSCGAPRHRHATIEISKFNYLLTCVGERRIPQATSQLIAELLMGDDVIKLWPGTVILLRPAEDEAFRAGLCQILNNAKVDISGLFPDNSVTELGVDD